MHRLYVKLYSTIRPLISKILICIFFFSNPALADKFVTSMGNCKIYAENKKVSFSMASLGAYYAISGLPSDKKDQYMFGPLCKLDSNGSFRVLKHPDSPKNATVLTATKDGVESDILYATLRNCVLTVKYWQSGGRFRNLVSYNKSCLNGTTNAGWKVTSKIPSDLGFSYFIKCGNGRSVTLEYNRDLAPSGYFASWGNTFPTLDGAARFKCSN